jgi:uncharacterized protein YjbI with pentapeptide repeats
MGKKISFITEHDNKAQTLGEPPAAAERKISDIKIPERKAQEGKSHESKSVAVKSEVRPPEKMTEKLVFSTEPAATELEQQLATKTAPVPEAKILDKTEEKHREKLNSPFSGLAVESAERVLMDEAAFAAAIDAEYRPIHGPIFDALAKISEPLADVSEQSVVHKDFESIPENFASLADNLDDLERLVKLNDPAEKKLEPEEEALAAKNLAESIHPTNVALIELAEILDKHKEWVESGGESGAKADLSGANLEGADLTGVNLQGAILTKANLSGADLSMANFRGANLVHAELRNTTLLGTELRGANLMGATLYGSEGLWAGRLGGTNLFDALLPESVAEFNSTKPIADASKVARFFYFLTMAVAVVCCALIIFTSDLRLVLNASAVPGVHGGDFLPMVGFYLGAPILLFALYVRFHFLLLRLWGSIAALPAVFPDGQTPERDGPWFLMGLIRKHLRWLRDGRSPLAVLETTVAMALGYWVVPATLALFWIRYLVRQDFRGTLLQVLLITVSVACATGLPRIVARVLRPGEIRISQSKNLLRVALQTMRPALITGFCLLVISVGVHRGLPADTDIAPEHSSLSMARWSAQLFQSVGYRPYADLTEATLSAPPATWTDEAMANVEGARLNQMHLRFARCYRSFLMNAKLWRADLEGAYLSEADLRGANLREADLRGANFDRAQVSKAVLVSAKGTGAKFVSADLRGADLSYGSFDGADMSSAKLGGTSLYGATLQGARMQRTDLTRTDLRDTRLESAAMSFANLQDADLSSAKMAGANLSGAQMKNAIVLDADLTRADLRGAFLGGAVLRGVALEGANLSGADLRGATGLSSAQVCAARWQSALLDADLLAEVQGKCGAGAAAANAVAPAGANALSAVGAPVNVPAAEVAKQPAVAGSAAAVVAAPAGAKPAATVVPTPVTAKTTATVTPASAITKPAASTVIAPMKKGPDAGKTKEKSAAIAPVDADKAKGKPAANVAAADAAKAAKQKSAATADAAANKAKKKVAAAPDAKSKANADGKAKSAGADKPAAEQQ